ncbi:MAG: tryptophan synthase subunit alpha [Deltaproteobacteria bacterium]|nr:tryptophan synthase subunit alpha [Deltaproteobacteria bacterium]
MSRIKSTFAALKKRHEVALVPFIMAGDPDLETTRQLLLAAADAGADLIELGVPFSDPTADGPVIQRAGVRALAQGTSLRQILELVAELRRGGFETPLVLFGYYNPYFHYGPERLVADARQAGVDGLLVVDLPPEEADELWTPARAAGLDIIFLLAPTSDRKRVKTVLAKASGFVYFVSMTGVTGSRAIDTADVAALVGDVRKQCRLPIGVGFGISTPEQAAAVACYADAVVVGSAITRLIEIEHGSPALVRSVGAFIRVLKDATRAPAAA